MRMGQTGGKAAEREERPDRLECSEALLNGIRQECPIPQLVIDRSHRVVFWNRALEVYTGISAESMAGTRDQWRAFYDGPRPILADLLVDEDIKDIPGWYPGKYQKSRLIDGAYEATDFFPHIGKGGTWLYFTAAPIRDPAGDIIGAMETLEDVTDRKRAEESLRRSEHLLAEGERIAAWGSWDWDIGSDRLYCSEGLERILGLKHGCPLSLAEIEADVVYQEDRETFRKNLQKALDESSAIDCEFRIIRQDGSGEVRVMHVRGTVKRDNAGRPRRMIGTGQDITGRKRAEEALLDAKAQAELYLDLMGHDINNFDQIGIGYLEMALDLLKLSEADRELIAKPLEMMRESSRLIATVENIQKARMGLAALVPVDLGRALSGAISHCRDLPGRNVAVHYDPCKNCMVLANDLLQDVFTNIIGNAIKHSEGPLTITVKVSRMTRDGMACYRVLIEDNGPGIPDELKSKLFTRYQRGQSHAVGKGLGLYITRELVESYHGKIEVEDRVPGDSSRGAKFIVTIPAMR